jgi:hypothetical protein
MANALQRAEYKTRKKFWAGVEEIRQMHKEIAQSHKEIARSQKETDQQITRLNKQMGDLHRKFGEMAEHLVAPGIAKRFNDLGYHFDEVSPGGHKILDEQSETKTEIDLLLQNDDYVIAVEVKTTPKLKDVEHHIKRLEILREHRSRKRDMRAIRGAIAGAIFGAEEKQAAIEAGMYVLEQSGDTMKMKMPAGFTPRDW